MSATSVGLSLRPSSSIAGAVFADLSSTALPAGTNIMPSSRNNAAQPLSIIGVRLGIAGAYSSSAKFTQLHVVVIDGVGLIQHYVATFDPDTGAVSGTKRMGPIANVICPQWSSIALCTHLDGPLEGCYQVYYQKDDGEIWSSVLKEDQWGKPVKDYLSNLGEPARGTRLVAAFDTRTHKPVLIWQEASSAIPIISPVTNLFPPMATFAIQADPLHDAALIVSAKGTGMTLYRANHLEGQWELQDGTNTVAALLAGWGGWHGIAGFFQLQEDTCNVITPNHATYLEWVGGISILDLKSSKSTFYSTTASDSAYGCSAAIGRWQASAWFTVLQMGKAGNLLLAYETTPDKFGLTTLDDNILRYETAESRALDEGTAQVRASMAVVGTKTPVVQHQNSQSSTDTEHHKGPDDQADPTANIPISPPVEGGTEQGQAGEKKPEQIPQNASGDSGPGIEPVRLRQDIGKRHYCRDVAFSLGDKAPQTAMLHASSKVKQLRGGMKAVMTQTGKLWDKGIEPINFGFLPGPHSGTTTQRDKVRSVITEWERYGHFHFEEVQDIGMADVRITFDPSPDEGSWSLIGTDSAVALVKDATLNLGWIDLHTVKASISERATILHEFGHVLGMLHEHQSPAGGGVEMIHMRDAIKFYGDTQHWDEKTIRTQVMETYNNNQVSSYSQVDRQSIMQYPMPASVTGLDYDIGYNNELSMADKAYMSIMYPRRQAHEQAKEWTFDYALQQTSVCRESPNVAQAIRAAYAKALEAPGDAVDSTEVRKLFSDWCHQAHKARPGSADAAGKAHGFIDGQNNPPGVELSLGRELSVIVSCATQQIASDTSSRKRLSDATPAQYAVNQTGIELGDTETADYVRTITWATVDCPYLGSDGNGRLWTKPTDWQIAQLKKAMKTWSQYASVEFEQAPQLTEVFHTYDPSSPPELIICFQKFRYDTAAEIRYQDEEDLQSYYSASGIDEAGDPSRPDVPHVRHHLCYRGIAREEADALHELDARLQVPAIDHRTKRATEPITVGAANMDSLLHQLGHHLGLEHEGSGVYGRYVFRDEALDANLLQASASTRFDATSIMSTRKVLTDLERSAGIKDPDDPRRLIWRSCGLTCYDQANIALAHPGRQLTEEKLRRYRELLKLPASAFWKLLPSLTNHKWNQFRRDYLTILKDLETDWYQKDKDRQRNITTKTSNAGGILPINEAAEGGAAHGFEDRKSGAAPPVQSGTPRLLDQLYAALAGAVAPTGSQFLTLQSPTRYLSSDEFAFELDGSRSNFVKPVVVAEAEFRLTDALYDASAIVSAPSGRSLSLAYDQALQNLVPKYEAGDRPVREGRERIRKWLLAEVGKDSPYYKYEYNTAGGGAAGDPELLKALEQRLTQEHSFVRRMTRMEFASQLSQDSATAQRKWELDRDDMIAKALATKDPVAIEAVTRKLVHITQSEQQRLATKYSESVVRGYSHVVQEAIAHLDVRSAAESLQDAKDAFRTSAVSSLYGGSKVYPVLMSPVDWATSLNTNFIPDDVVGDPDNIRMQMKAKSQIVDNLQRQLALLQSGKDGDVTKLQAAVNAAATLVDNSEADLSSSFTESAIQLAKIIVASTTGGATMTADALTARIQGAATSDTTVKQMKDLDDAAKTLDPEATAIQVIQQVNAVNNAQRKLQRATASWTSKRSALARASATDSTANVKNLERQLDSWKAELLDLNERLQTAERKASWQSALVSQKGADSVSVTELATKPTTGIAGGSRWQDINLSHRMDYMADSSATDSGAGSLQGNVSLWVGSIGGGTEGSGASYAAGSSSMQLSLDVSMKITLVTVDRSSWFQPHLLDSSPAFMRLNMNSTFCNYPDGLRDHSPAEAVAAMGSAVGQGRPLPRGSLPCFPVGYIICKDVLITVANSTTMSDQQKAHMLKKSQTSSGCLCFSYNRASESQTDGSAASFQAANNGMVIRIPGPQILGYIQQLMPDDLSSSYDPALSLANEFYLPEDIASGAPLATARAFKGTDGLSSGDKYKSYNFDIPATEKAKDKATEKPSDKPVEATASRGYESVGSNRVEGSADRGGSGTQSGGKSPRNATEPGGTGTSTDVKTKLNSLLNFENEVFRELVKDAVKEALHSGQL